MIYFTELFRPCWFVNNMINESVNLNITKITKEELKELVTNDIGLTGCSLTQSAIKAISYLNKPMVNGGRIPPKLEINDSIVVINFDAKFDKTKRIYDIEYEYYLVTVGQ